MPLAGGRFYRYKRYRYRRKRKYGKKRWYRKNRIASSRSRLSVRIPVTETYSFTIAANSRSAQRALAVCPWCKSEGNSLTTATGACQGGIRSRLYESYSMLFDEVKCDGFKVKMTVIGNTGNTTNVSIGSCTDRKTSLQELTTAPPTWEQMRDYAGFVEKNFAAQSVMKCSRSLWAADLLDRSAFIDGNVQMNGASPSRTWYEKSFDQNTPPMFAPVLWVMPYLGAALTADSTMLVQFQTVFYFTFRSPRYGGGENSKAGETIPSLPFTPEESETIAAVNAVLDDDGKVSMARVREEEEVLDEDTQPPTKKQPIVMTEYVDPKNGGSSSQLSDQEVAILRQLLAQEASSGESI